MLKKVLFTLGIICLANCIMSNVLAGMGGSISRGPAVVNASPAIVSVSATAPRQEVTFPQAVRDVSVFNFDPDDGLWINWSGGDTDDAGVNSSRFYLGPSSVVTLNDFLTDRITIINDRTFTIGDASPVSVIGTY